MLRIAHEFSVIDSCSRWQSTCNEIENWMADISKVFEVPDILWFLKAITDLIVSGGKDAPVIRIDILEGQDHF
jgi:hypothetical protein